MLLCRRVQRTGPFSIWPVWKSMCHKLRVHALCDADNSQPIVPFYEVDNLHSVSLRLVPVPPRLRRLVCRPIHSFTPQISIPLLIPFHQIVDHLPKHWFSVSVLQKKASPNSWPTYCRGMRTTMQASEENLQHSQRSPPVYPLLFPIADIPALRASWTSDSNPPSVRQFFPTRPFPAQRHPVSYRTHADTLMIHEITRKLE